MNKIMSRKKTNYSENGEIKQLKQNNYTIKNHAFFRSIVVIIIIIVAYAVITAIYKYIRHSIHINFYMCKSSTMYYDNLHQISSIFVICSYIHFNKSFANLVCTIQKLHQITNKIYRTDIT